MKNFRKFFKYLLTGQFGKVLSALRGRIPPPVYRYAKAYVLENRKTSQDLNHIETINTPNGIVFRICQRGDLLACSKLLDIPIEECCRRYDAGDFCLGAFHGDKLVNLGWVHQGSFYVKGIGFHENSNENISYLYNTMTESFYRGKGLYKTSIYLISKIVFQKCSTRVITMVLQDNHIVLNVLANMGFKKTKIIRHLTILGVQYTAVENMESKDVSRKIFLRMPDAVYVI
jgi:hypothetical protein